MYPFPEHIVEAAQVLRVDRVSAEIFRSLGAAGVRAFLMKGPSFRRWLYPDGGRSYVDTDVLVSPDQIDLARAVLTDAGFGTSTKKRAFDEPQPGYAWRRPRDGADVDLHESIHGVRVAPQEFWRFVCSEPEEMEVGGQTLEIFSTRLRTLHVVLHAAQHRYDRPSTRSDLKAAVRLLGFQTWVEALEAARRLDAVDAFRRGLAVQEEGRGIALGLGLDPWEDPGPTPQLVIRHEWPMAPVVGGLEWFLRTRGVRARGALLWHKLFSKEALLAWSPLAAKGRVGLFLARLYRPFWLLRRTPRAVMRVRQAKAVAARGPDGRAGRPPWAPRKSDP